jgi:hypothetical protein
MTVFNTFDFGKMKTDATVVSFGETELFLVEEIIYNKSFTSKLVISSNQMYKNIVNPVYVRECYSQDLLMGTINFQGNLVSKERKTKNNTMFIYIDNLLPYDTAFRKLMFEGRHHNIFTLVSLQSHRSISPGIRANIDYIFLFYYPDLGIQKEIYDTFGWAFSSFEEFQLAYVEMTKEHHCMVIDRTVSNPKSITDCVFVY